MSVKDLARKLIRFVSATAKDVLLPNILDKVLRVGENFYQCFLATNLNEQLQLFSEAEQLSPQQIDEAAQAIVEHWQQATPDVPLPADALRWAKQIVENLCQASLAKSQHPNPAEALRRSLNSSLLSASGQQIPPRQLSRDQQAVGSLLTSGILEGTGDDVFHSGVLPPDAPQIPGYELLRILGSGGFSMVYLARHQSSGELRAIKFGNLEDKHRLQREINILKNVQSEHLVDYFEHGEIGERYWIAMEYLGDHSLARLLSNPASRPNPEQALLIGEQILYGLKDLHQKGIIHRDLKPANVMIDPCFRLKLIDFGLSKPFHASPDSRSGTVTIAGHTVGTPQYMSPEQARSADLTFSSDVWSFGVMLYEMFTGASLFQATTLLELGSEIFHKPIDLEHGSIPNELRPLLTKCLQRDVEKRFANASATLAEYGKHASELGKRLRHERYREKWIPVLDQKLLEEFAAIHHGRLPEDASTLFLGFANEKGVEEVDAERLDEILPPIFEQQSRVEEAGQAIEQAKQQLQQEIPTLTTEQIQERVNLIQPLEAKQRDADAQTTETVRQLLADETRTWEKIKEEEAAAAELREQARLDAERRELEAARIQQEREAEQARIQQEREAENWRKRREAEFREAHESQQRKEQRDQMIARAVRLAIISLAVGLLWYISSVMLRPPTGVARHDGAIGGAIVGAIIGAIVGVRCVSEEYRVNLPTTIITTSMLTSVLGGIGGTLGAMDVSWWIGMFPIAVIAAIFTFIAERIFKGAKQDPEKTVVGFCIGLLIALVTLFVGNVIGQSQESSLIWFHLQGGLTGLVIGACMFGLFRMSNPFAEKEKNWAENTLRLIIVGGVSSFLSGFLHPVSGLFGSLAIAIIMMLDSFELKAE